MHYYAIERIRMYALGFFGIIRDFLIPYVKILMSIFDQTDPKASNILAQETTIKVSLSK